MVTREGRSWIASRFIRLSTGLKMLLILSLGLFPLGLIAIIASVDSANQNRAKREEDTRAIVEFSAQRINFALSRAALTIRAASTAIGATPPGMGICQATLKRLSQAEAAPGRYALYGADNQVRCATPGFTPPQSLSNPQGEHSQVRLDSNTLYFTLFGNNGRIEGTGEIGRKALMDLANPPELEGDFDLDLVQDGHVMPLRDTFEGGPLVRNVVMTEPVASGRIQLRITAAIVPISAAEMLMILLPVMMWAGAAAIGWLIVDRLLLRPLVRMQKVVSAYRPGDRELDLPPPASPAREIGQLGRAFDRMTKVVARHETDLESAVERQKRLVREVHHRVKNNLQVVASLLNLHSRGSKNEDVAAAYASIQRRVDALAVVHRNHYAELEQNRGVALKPLISELAANLRATAPASAAQMSIRLDIEPYYVTQDVAVSVAFLITEMVECAMFREARYINIALYGQNGGSALLVIESDKLREEGEGDDMSERFDRIVTGLSRQLRSTIDHDNEAGRYCIPIAVVDKAER